MRCSATTLSPGALLDELLGEILGLDDLREQLLGVDLDEVHPQGNDHARVARLDADEAEVGLQLLGPGLSLSRKPAAKPLRPLASPLASGDTIAGFTGFQAPGGLEYPQRGTRRHGGDVPGVDAGPGAR
jgi:hypothetical protein